MNKAFLVSGLLAFSLLLTACNRDAQQDAASAAADATAEAPRADAATPVPAESASTETEPDYEIPPFPISGVEICDRYASEARRCLNEVGDNKQRHVYETEINTLLDKVTPKGDESVNEWLTSDCRRGLDNLAMRFRQCAVEQ